jgi:hypothetical protein
MTHTFPCGCEFSDAHGPALVYCPLHSAAEGLREACQAVLSVLHNPLSSSVGHNQEVFRGDAMFGVRATLRAALASTKKSPNRSPLP